jgi:pimeloyl-ACP methyl ester carboxylesterase
MTAPALDRRTFAALLATGAAATALGANPALAAATTTPAAPPTPPAPWTSEGFVDRPGGRLHYLSMGDGPPLVLLHKLGGWAPEWRGIAPLLARHFRLIAFDMPGHGESAMLGKAPYIMTLGEHAAMIHAALRDMGVERFHLMGASLGGCASIVLAASYPRAVSRLALLSTALFSVFPLADVAAEDAKIRDRYGPNWEPLPRTGDQVKEFANLDPSVNDELNRSRAAGGAWVRASERGVEVAGVDTYLPRIEAPTLLVYPDRGRYTPFESVGRKNIRNVEVAIIKDSGSFIYQEKPAETAAAVLPFLMA